MKRLLMLLALAVPAALCSAETLSLQAYLDDVEAGNAELASARASLAGYDLAPLEAGMAFSPYLSARSSVVEDRSKQMGIDLNTFSYGLLDATYKSYEWSLGLDQLLPTGTAFSLGYSWLRYETASTDPLAATGPWNQGTASLTVSQSLWKGFWARGARAAQAQAHARARSAQAQLRMGQKALRLKAEGAYFGLGLAREKVALLEESLDRNRRLLDWMKARRGYGLTQEADQLATEAAVAQAELALSQARSEEEEAGRLFNALRGGGAAPLNFSLEDPGDPVGPLGGPGQRGDVTAAERDLEALDALAVETAERWTPDLKVFATWRGNGMDAGADSALSGSFAQATSAQVYGASLSMPLDLATWLKVRKGADLAKASGAEALRAKRLEAARERADLEARWRETARNLELAARADSLLRRRAELEKDRYRAGRSSNYMVLQAQEQSTGARLALAGLKVQARILQAQARLWQE